MIFSLLEVDRHMHLYRDVKTASLRAFSTFRVSSDMSRNPLIHTVLSEVDWWASRQTVRSYTDKQTSPLILILFPTDWKLKGRLKNIHSKWLKERTIPQITIPFYKRWWLEGRWVNSYLISEFHTLLLQVVTVDARNHGQSDHSPDMNYFDQSLDLWHLFQKLELSKAILMGHSMGGKTAMTFALSHPEFVDSLIVVDMSPTKLSLDEDIPRYLATKRAMDLNLIKDKKDAEKMLMDVVPVSAVH